MNYKKYTLLICLLILSLVVMPSVVQAQSNSEDVNLEDLEVPTKLGDLMEIFSALDYRVTIIDEGQQTQDTLISYVYQGRETVQGTETDNITIEIITSDQENTLMQFWLDDEEKILQAEVDGEVLPAEAVGMMSDNLLQTVFLPFQNLSQYDLERIEENGEVSRSQETVAGHEVEVIRIEAEDMPEYELKRGVTRLAAFEEFLLVISYDFVSSVEDYEVNFAVEEIELKD